MDELLQQPRPPRREGFSAADAAALPRRLRDSAFARAERFLQENSAAVRRVDQALAWMRSFNPLIFLAAGVLFVLWRLRSARRAASMPSESAAVDASADPAAAPAASTAGNRPRHEGGTA